MFLRNFGLLSNTSRGYISEERTLHSSCVHVSPRFRSRTVRVRVPPMDEHCTRQLLTFLDIIHRSVFI
jgi:hypothetical protein